MIKLPFPHLRLISLIGYHTKMAAYSLLSLCLIHVVLMIRANVVKPQCLQTNSEDGLPFFQGYSGSAGEPDRRIQHQHQAIITSYKFNCCGNITAWGVDLNPEEESARFTFDFQVWRPSPTVNEDGCYSLVNNFITRSISLTTSPAVSHVARVTPSPEYQLQFQPGDVLGFYVESHGTTSDNDNGVVLLGNGSHTSELVWFASIAQPSQSADSCPYPVGTNGELTTSTNAAPVISISVTSYSCAKSSAYAISSVQLPPQQTPTIPIPTTPATPNTDSLIAGVVVAVIIVCIAIMIVIVMLAIAFTVKRHNAVKKRLDFTTNADSLALANQVYGAPESERPGHANPPVPVRYTDCNPGSNRAKTYTLDKEKATQPVLYHSIGPVAKGTASHMYTDGSLEHVYQYADTDLQCPSQSTTSAVHGQEAAAYEIPREELFYIAGLYVPTAEERSNRIYGNDQEEWDANAYSKTQFFVEDDIYWAPASTTSDLYSQLASKKLLKAIGSGEFGNVYKAVWSISGSTKEVAIKTLKPGSSENDTVRFLQEAAIMGQFNHPYIVKLYGVVTLEDPIMICIELMSGGDLRGYLGTLSPDYQKAKKLESQLLRFSREIAAGMAYLSKKAFVHRDLAARNILLDEALTCKISDFGMARDLDDDTYYTVQSQGGKIPVKWTAPEALFYRKYSTDSDVWSYGMVLFEIWSVGKKPFSQITNKEVLKKINSGYCQPPPPGTPRPIYQLMVDCWNPTHSQRPPFSKISATLNASSSTLLQWTGNYRSVAGQLGGQLSEAAYLYQELQKTYS